ncbi:GDPmannose 4,6-dehydratase [Nonomuraea polychroma]|uniref:GDP-mannose 4,6-dehydratase n=1 Tax=Nonomuraea polychroma TaxID=46176 RepID=A0A438MFH1_9ACTN|nr:GDP-mannose 4,6-dehydratase [Nonomuraea polychroma]RVX44570.1 GDPmannose 4,6-dehydratase [Nonomuraea polychroma]
MSRSVVIGAEGQDGTLLCELLAARGDDVTPVGRQGPDITSPEEVTDLVRKEEPDEIYLLAAVQHSSQGVPGDPAGLARRSYEVNTLPVVFFAEAIRRHSPHTRLFYAASSHVFGEPTEPIQDESTPLRPASVYGITKAAGLLHCRAYRESGFFVSAGILYNHESPLRRPEFVTRKIVQAVARIQREGDGQVTLGRLSAVVDWGYAPDYVAAMTAILAASEPGDFIVASGQGHTVGDFAQTAFALAGLDWSRHVREDPGVLTRGGTTLIGNPAKLRRLTGWRPTVDFTGMIRKLLEAEGVTLASQLIFDAG